MNAFWSQTVLGLKLAVRNRIGLIYGFIFPLLFLAAFRAIYRHEVAPLALHLGELLTVTVLGGACFGLPTTLVSERERGVWRRYRLTPASPWLFVASTMTTRYLLILGAAALQIAVARATGMPPLTDALGVWVAFTVASAAFLSMGMFIAQLAPNVPAVQALGQCVFLPMLMIGGVGVKLSSLPPWALHASAFFPGRYAVLALQRSVTGNGQRGGGFELMSLLLIAAANGAAALALFRWDSAQRVAPRRRALGLVLALGVWALVGVGAELRHNIAVIEPESANVSVTHDFLATLPEVAAVTQPRSWREVTPQDFKRVAYERLPPDDGLIAPIARTDEVPDALVASRLQQIQAALMRWPPGQVDDAVQRVRNILYVAALPDLLQMGDVERFIPQIVFDRLKGSVPYVDLRRILYWIALHPNEGNDSALGQLDAIGLPDGAGATQAVRARVMLYAFKFLGRMTGDIRSE